MTAGFTPPGDGVVSVVSDGTINVSSPSGPTVTLGAKLGVPFVPPAVRVTPLTTSTLPGVFPYAGAATYVSLGSAMSPLLLPAGVYRSTTVTFVKVSAANTEWWLDIFINGQPSQTLGVGIEFDNQPLGKAGASGLIGGPVLITLAGPGDTPIWLDVKVAKGGGTGSVTYSYSYILIERLS